MELIRKILQKRHFWRNATFSEVADIYASRTLRIAATNMGAGFTAVYLYQYGYSIEFIITLFAIMSTACALLMPLASMFVARFGIAQSTLVSNILYIPAMIAMVYVPNVGILALTLFVIFWAPSSAIYHISYSLDFSKVKNPISAGKEIGFMNILDKIASSVTPVIGGLIALVFGPQSIMWVAGFLFAVSALPLFLHDCHSEKRQRISIKGFPWKMAFSSLRARVTHGFDEMATTTAWSLFLVVYLFAGANNEIYVIIGGLSSIAIVVAIITSAVYGRIIDRDKGGSLLEIGNDTKALAHLARIFVTTPADVVGVNAFDEAASAAYDMAYMRGMFDTADNSGHRIMYITMIEMAFRFGTALSGMMLLLCLAMFNGIVGFQVFFFLTAVIILIFGRSRFQLYRKR